MEVLLFLTVVVLILVAGLTTRRPDTVSRFEQPADPRPPPSGGIG